MKKPARPHSGAKQRTTSSPPHRTPSPIDALGSLIGSDKLLDLVLNSVRDLVVVLDRTGKRIYNSPSYRSILGDPSSLKGTSSFIEIHPDDREHIEKVFRETIRTGEGQKATFRFLLPNGTVRFIESQGHIIRDAEGKICFVVVISNDITTQQQTRSKLGESEAMFHGLVEHSLVGVFIAQDGYVKYANPLITTLTGYRADELIDKIKLFDILDDNGGTITEEIIRRGLEQSLHTAWQATRLRRKDGVLIDLEVSAARTTYQGQPAIIGTLLDVTERRRSETLQLALYTITEKASTVRDMNELYAAIHATLGEMMYVRNFYIALYDAQTQDLSFPYFVDEFDPPPPPHKLGRGLTEYVLRTGKPILASPEVFQHLVDQGEVVLIGGPSVDWLGVPLILHDTIHGVIVVQSYSDAIRFGPKDMEFLTYISRHIAVAIDRKQTEAALRESEEKHRTIIAGMSDGIVLHDEQGDIVSWNASALRILDLSPEEIAQLRRKSMLGDPTHEDGSPLAASEDPIALTLSTGAPHSDLVVGFRTRSGQRRWISVNTRPLLRSADERPYAVVASITDITRRKEAENALYRSERRFRSMVEAIPDWLWETDADGRYTYASPKVRDLLGYDPTEVLGRRARDFMHPADVQRGSMQLLSYISRSEPYAGFENSYTRKDGSTVVIETSGLPIFDEQGHLKGYRGIDRDVTQRKHEEGELARLNMAVEQAAESIVVTEADGTIVYVNPAFEKLSGYSRAEALGKNPRLIRSGVHDDAFYKEMWETITRGEVWSGHVTNRKKDASLYEEQMVISPVRDTTGKIVNYVAVKRDMTQEVEMERRLRQTQKMESLGHLAGGIAHDFNNVLGVIQGALSLLKPRLTDPSLARYVEVGEGAVGRGADVAKRLLTFSREGQLTLRTVTLAEATEELTRVLEHTIEKTIDIVTEIPPDIPCILADPGQLGQVFLNLCINGRDAILEARPEAGTGTLTIVAALENGEALRKRFKEAVAPSYVRISVIDNGTGMTDLIRSRVFEPFFTTKPAGKGTGLGLAVAYGIVKNHRGFIDVESEPGKGSVFHVYVQASTAAPSAGSISDERPITGGTETILVVEDEKALRDLLAELLEGSGYRVLKAADGIEGLAVYRQYRREIGVVLTDMGLPRMSGQDLFARIRELDPAAPIVLASGYLEPSLRSHLSSAGAKAFIQKPYQTRDILRIIREVLDHPEHQTEGKSP